MSYLTANGKLLSNRSNYSLMNIPTPITYGPELLINGDFHDGNNWELPGEPAYTVISGGVANVSGAAWEAFLAQSENQNPAFLTTIGHTYRVTFTLVRTSGNIYVRLSGTEDTDHIWNSSGEKTVDIVAGSQDPNQIAFICYDTAYVGTIDNISVKEVL